MGFACLYIEPWQRPVFFLGETNLPPQNIASRTTFEPPGIPSPSQKRDSNQVYLTGLAEPFCRMAGLTQPRLLEFPESIAL